MKLDTILDLSLSRVDETVADADDTAMLVVKNAINQAYMAVRATVDKRVHTVDIPVTDSKPIPLPKDCIEVARILHNKEGEYSLTDYYQQGDDVYFYPIVKPGSLSVSYIQAPVLPDTAADPKDLEVDVKDMYVFALIAYGAYAYQLYRKKYSAAQILLNEYNSILGIQTSQPQQ